MPLALKTTGNAINRAVQRPVQTTGQQRPYAGSGAASNGTAGKDAALENFVLKENRISKIFETREGNLTDTPANRSLIMNVVNDPANKLGVNKFGNTWYAKTLQDGDQVWVQTRNGQVWNGGINNPPKKFNADTGLAAPVRPGWK